MSETESVDTAPPEVPHAPVPSDPRPHHDAWLRVLPWALLTVAVLAPFSIDGHPDRAVLASIGAVALPALLVAVVCAVVASRSSSAWSWWLYPPIVVLPAVALVVLTDLVPDRLENAPGQRRRTATAASPPRRCRARGRCRSGLGAEEPGGRARGQASPGPTRTSRPCTAQYRRRGDDVLIYNGINVTVESGLARELVGRPEDALPDYLDGTGITDVAVVRPGDLQGAMACGTVPRTGPVRRPASCAAGPTPAASGPRRTASTASTTRRRRDDAGLPRRRDGRRLSPTGPVPATVAGW